MNMTLHPKIKYYTLIFILIFLTFISSTLFGLEREGITTQKIIISSQQKNDTNNDDGDDPSDPFANDGDTDDPFANDGDTSDPFKNDGDDTDDPFKNDGDTDDPFANDGDDTSDPFANNGDDDEMDPSDLFGDDDDKSLAPTPDLMIKGNVGLALPMVFLNNSNELIGNYFDSPEEKFRYLACEVYGNVNADYKFFGVNLFGSIDFLASTDFSGLPEFNINLRELYLSYVNNFMVLKFGRLLVPWSSMNVFTVTNYFNPLSDTIYSKEFLEGVNGIHTQFYFAGSMSFEFVLVPLFTNVGLHSNRMNMFLGNLNSISSIDMGSLVDDLLGREDLDNPFIDNDDPSSPKVYTFDTSTPSLSLLNTQVGVRYGVKFGWMDLYLIYFHGFDKMPQFSYTHSKIESSDLVDPDNESDLDEILEDIDEPLKGVKVLVKKEYNIIDSFAISSTFNVWQLTFNAEMDVTINDPILVEKEVTIEEKPYMDRYIAKSPTMNISLGLRWEFLNDFLLMIEFNEFFIFKDINPIKDSTLGGSILLTLAYTLKLEPLDTMFTQTAYFDYYDLQLVTISYVRMDFKFGLYGEIGVGYMNDIEATTDGDNMTEGIFNAFNRSVLLVLNVYYEF